MRVPNASRFTAAASSSPVMRGISMSVSSTSGFVSRQIASALSPSCARPTTSMSPSISSSAASAPRTIF
ncbi:hypothetical protein D3C83_30210 [compost metagenome]